MAGVTDAAAARWRAMRELIAGIREPMRVLGMPIECSASIGVALFSGGELTAAELLRRADRAMYIAKEAGRNGYRIFTG